MSKEGEELAADLKAVKMLIILQLLRSGITQSHIAAALGISEATMSRMLPKGLAKSVSKLATIVDARGEI